jgi:sensor histidine kinase regulating citrate/malate metabolism
VLIVCVGMLCCVGQIHWLSIINSFVLVLLLTAFLAVILMRVLKNDFSRYMEMDEVSKAARQFERHFLF